MASKAERLLNLLAVLRETGRPLPAGEIRERVPGYPDSSTAFKRAFERDKAALREMGVEIAKEPVPASEEGIGYRVAKRTGRLPNPGLDPGERAAMAVALGAIAVFPPEEPGEDYDPARELLYGALKIGVDPDAGVATDVAAYFRVPAERLAALVEAILERRLVEFEYEKADGTTGTRRVEPHGVRCVRNNWYLACAEPGDDHLKVFRIDRIRSGIQVASDSDAFERRDVGVVDEVLQGAPWSMGGGEVRRAKIAVEAPVASLAERVFQCDPSGDDGRGRHVLEVEFSNAGALLDAVSAFRERVEVLYPSFLRDAIRKKLETAAANLSAPAAGSETAGAVELAMAARDGCEAAPDGDRRESDSKKRQEAAERARRLVIMVPWLVQNPGVSVEEVASKFGVSRDVVVKDLTMVTLTGVYPYTPADLVDVSLSDDRVVVRSADYLKDFTNLTIEEAVVLYSALRAARRLPGLSGSAELDSGIAKLGSALGLDGADVEIVSERAESETLELLSKAISCRETVEMTYVSYSSERETTREVDPHRLFVYDGRWYLYAYCHLADEERVFRVARISNLSPTGRRFEVSANRGEDSESGTDEAAGESQGIRLPGRQGWNIEGIDLEVVMPPVVAAWFTRSYPTICAVELDNGWYYVKMKASTMTWATKVLFGIADRIGIISPDAVRARLLESVERALALYAGSDT